MDEEIRYYLEKIMTLQDDEVRSHISFVRGLTTVSTGLLGLLVGLRPEVLPSNLGKIMFLLSTPNFSAFCTNKGDCI